MALIKCPMCGKNISPNAESCPGCGEPVKGQIKENSSENGDLYNVILLDGGIKHINVIQQIRIITGSSLREAYDSFNNVPSIIIKNIDYPRAVDYKIMFEDLGAKINIASANEKNKSYINGQSLETLIRCKNCGSCNTRKISIANKAGSAMLFGIFSAGKLAKTYQCNKCGYRW